MQLNSSSKLFKVGIQLILQALAKMRLEKVPKTVPCKQLKFLLKAYFLKLRFMYPICQDSLPSNITSLFRNAPKYQFHLLGSSRSSLLKVKRSGPERQIQKKKSMQNVILAHFSPFPQKK